jgi:hypothetical protein
MYSLCTMPMVGGSAEKIGRVVLGLWERGLYFFWAVACASAAMFIVLMAASWFHPGSGPNVFKTYGWLPLIVAIGAAILGVWRKLEERPTPTVFLVGNEDQSFWGQSRQKDGRVITQFCFRMHATNLTSDPVELRGLKLVQPRVKRDYKELASRVMTQHSTQNVYGQYPINPQAFSRVCCDLIVDRPLGKPGKTIRAIVAVSDERGRWHKVKFDKLRSSTGPGV